MSTVLEKHKARFNELVQPIIAAQGGSCSEETRPLADMMFDLMVCKHTPAGRPEYNDAERVFLRSVANWFNTCRSERVGDLAQFLLDYLGKELKFRKIFLAVAQMCSELKNDAMHVHEEIQAMEAEAAIIEELQAQQRHTEGIENDEADLVGDPFHPEEELNF